MYATTDSIATDRDGVIVAMMDDGIDSEIAECFAEDAGMIHNEGFVTRYCNEYCDLICERHPAGRLSRNDYINYGS